MKMRFILPVLLLLLLLSACTVKEQPSAGETAVQETEETPPPPTQIPNPLKIAQSLEELAELIGFTPPVPNALPDGYAATTYISISDEIAQITYTKDNFNIVYRMKKGDGSISGDYNEYGYTVVVPISGVDVTVKGSGEDSLSLAEWTKDGNTFSLLYDVPIDEAALAEIVESIA